MGWSRALLGLRADQTGPGGKQIGPGELDMPEMFRLPPWSDGLPEYAGTDCAGLSVASVKLKRVQARCSAGVDLKEAEVPVEPGARQAIIGLESCILVARAT